MDRAVIQDFQQVRDVLEWLTPFNTSTKYNECIRFQEGRTWPWFLGSMKFKLWSAGIRSTVFCPGLPGAGKSVLAAAALKYLKEEYGHQPDFGIAYLYPPTGVADGRVPEELLANIVKQLVQCQGSIPMVILTLYKYHRIRNSRLTLDELVVALEVTLGKNPKAFILIDALDMHILDSDRRTLLGKLFYLQSKGRVNILATSRFSANIRAEFKENGSFVAPIYAHEDDIRSYARKRLSDIPHIARLPHLSEEIESAVVKSADKMYGAFTLSIQFVN